LARSIQKVAEEILLHIAKTTRARTQCRNLCLRARFGLDGVANAFFPWEKVFDDVWIPASEGDASAALGAALFVQFQLLRCERRATAHDSLKGALLGPRFTNEDIHGFLRLQQIKHYYFPDEHELIEKTIEALVEGNTVGWFQDRMEFAPHALGARSILADARNGAQTRKTSDPEAGVSFRPSAWSVLVEDMPAFFDLNHESPYMSLTAQIHERKSPAEYHDAGDAGSLASAKSRLPAPGSAAAAGFRTRIQTVDERRNGRYYRLIRELKRRTGAGMVTSRDFNFPGEPIVSTPQEAYCCFMMSDIDVLVLENCIVYKQPAQQNGSGKKG
jgi:carbamoyltransferase